MRNGARKPPKPTKFQTKILAMIARSPLIKTYRPDRAVVWGLQNGRLISEECANALVRNGWVKPERDGLGMFEESQTYTALTP